jgi:exopolysaccharide biosynthesis polyprenyl glycosylphosphotransferase
MNGPATRRSPTKEEVPPRELHARNWTAEHARSVRHARRHRSQGGRVRQAIYALIDITLVCAAATTVYGLHFGFTQPFGFTGLSLWQMFGRTNMHGYPGFLVLYCSLVVMACISQNLYRTPREFSALVESILVAKAVFLATALLVVFIFTSGNKEISRLVVVLVGAINVVSLSGWRYAKRRFVLSRAERGLGQSRVLIIGAGRVGRAFASWLQANPHLGYDICGFLDAHQNGDKRVLGTLQDFRRVALGQFVDEVFVTLPSECEMIKQVFLESQKLRLNLHVLPELYDGLAWRAPMHTIGGFPILELLGEPIPADGLALKRAMDVFVSAIGLLVASPLLLLAGLWIALDSTGPIIYSAPRVGEKGRKFQCYKLRTMVATADAQKGELLKENERQGPFFKIQDDPRITRCGHWLRRYSIDELPQLFNVLLGDMSLVGPRPHPVEDFEQYSLEDLRRLEVKPGITGLWQIKARRDPSFETNMKLDLDYIENWSLLVDLKILLKTFPEVYRGGGS